MTKELNRSKTVILYEVDESVIDEMINFINDLANLVSSDYIDRIEELLQEIKDFNVSVDTKDNKKLDTILKEVREIKSLANSGPPLYSAKSKLDA